MATGMNIKVFLVVTMSLLITDIARGAEIETLFMPGELIAGHAEYESECSRCHARFEKKTQDRLCRDCHEDASEQYQAHGRAARGAGVLQPRGPTLEHFEQLVGIG